MRSLVGRSSFAAAAALTTACGANAPMLPVAAAPLDSGFVETAPLDTGGCDQTADPRDEPCLVDDAYGVFVSPAGGAQAAGTKADPVALLSRAVSIAAAAGKHHVYVCQGAYADSVTLDAVRDGVSLHGGFACDSWGYAAAPTTVTALLDNFALRIDQTSAQPVVEDLTLVSPDTLGTDALGTGHSSIAALVHGATATFRRVVFSAGRGGAGMAGEDGASAPNYPWNAETAPAGFGPLPADAPTAPGAGGQNACADGSRSLGGTGGLGGFHPGTSVVYAGQDGSASPTALPSPPRDGAGGAACSAALSACLPAGDPGADGAAGAAALAANAYGALSASGWAPSPGGDGPSGSPGQGGGGGAGEGSPGGGGGAGGCGGAGGQGGRAGGASIALASIDAVVTLTACTLTASAGGQGGAGGAGQPGQGGGAGYAPTTGGGQGGAGGNGAGGAGGAGGTGGVSAALAFTGPAPAYDGLTSLSAGAFGAAGPGGRGAPHGTGPSVSGEDGPGGAPGRGGVSVPILSF